MAREQLAALGLAAKVIRAEVPLGGGRVTVYLCSEERLELRELARRLGAGLRARVELRHAGLRDAARIVGGVGPCGLQLCCNTFLAEFAPVSIRMAKDQGLALNPQRVSGVCGRLMCCLVYEDAFYRAQRAAFPRPGRAVETPRGAGRVREVDVLARTVRVALADGSLATLALDEVRQPAVSTANAEPAEESDGS
jgi:cell fate regulator YaaT (PSP1 superfamily)